MSAITVKRVYELLPGDYFIWLNDYTRDFMCVEQDKNHLQVMKFLNRSRSWVICQRLDGTRQRLYYDQKCAVIAFREKRFLMASGVRCTNCGCGYGQHYVNQDARLNGIRCYSKDSVDEWFVPCDESFADHYQELLTKLRSGTGNDFFASIGL